MEARELMMQPVATVRPSATLAEVIRVMLDRRIGCVPVVDERGKLCGIVTESNFADKVRCVLVSTAVVPHLFDAAMPRGAAARVREAARTTLVKEVMTAPVVTVEEGTHAEAVACLLDRHGFDHVVVVRDGTPVGIVSRHDFLRLMIGPEDPPTIRDETGHCCRDAGQDGVDREPAPVPRGRPGGQPVPERRVLRWTAIANRLRFRRRRGDG
jgi:CBS domain-containing protein